MPGNIDQAPTPEPGSLQPNPDQQVKNNGGAEGEKPFDVSAWTKKFKASETVMKAEFLKPYQLAKSRLRSDRDIKHRNSRTKMTHENVSLAYSIGTNFVNSVYFKAPVCNLTAREEEEAGKVELTEIQANDWIKDKKLKRTIKRIIWDAYTGGLGVRFMDYEYNDMNGEVIGFEKMPMVNEATGEMVEVDDKTKPIHNRIVLKNEVVFKRIRPDLVRFPKGFDLDNFQDSPWIGFDVILPISEVKANTDWDENARNAIEGEKYSKLSSVDNDKTSGDGDDLYAKISYVFEKPQSEMEPFKLTVFCGKYEDLPLKETDFDKGTIGYPIKFIYFNPLDDDYSYPVGDCWLFESQLSAIDTWWRRMVKHVDKSNPKRLYDSSAIADKEVSGLKSNNDLEWVGVVNKDRRDIRSFITDIQAPTTNPDAQILYEVSNQLISKIAPKSAMAQGSPDTQSGTATEAKIIATGDMIDVDARIDDVRGFIEDIVLDYVGILSKSLEAPIDVRVPEQEAQAGMPGVPSQVVEADRDSFTGKVTVDVDVESMQPMNKDMHRKQLIDALGLLTKLEPIMNKVGETINPTFWLTKIMDTLNIRNIEKGIMPLPPMPAMQIGPDGKPIQQQFGPQGQPLKPPQSNGAVPNEVAMAAAQEPQLQ